MGEEIFYQILQSREDRASFQKEIINKYNNPIISFTLNIPGPKKDSERYRKIHHVGMELIWNKLRELGYNIEYRSKKDKSTGPEGYFSVDIDPLVLKKVTVKIEEEHELGRLFDIDVFDKNHEQVGRRDLGINPRRCLICEEQAKVCSRAGTHSLEELIHKIDSIYNLYFHNF